jgi:hypothetical protein
MNLTSSASELLLVFVENIEQVGTEDFALKLESHVIRSSSAVRQVRLPGDQDPYLVGKAEFSALHSVN